MDTADLLTQFGLTRQEAILYLVLLAEGRRTGYEAAKETGISRSNTYTSLASLVEKGAAYTIEDTATRYHPVPVDEFCENRIRALQKAKLVLQRDVPRQKEDIQGYMTIKGQIHILNKMRNMILSANERIYLSAAGRVLSEVQTELKTALSCGHKIVLITDTPVDLDGATVYLTKKTEESIRLIADSANVLTGDLYGDSPACLYSAKKNLVDLVKDSLKNEIALIELMKGNEKDEKTIY